MASTPQKAKQHVSSKLLAPLWQHLSPKAKTKAARSPTSDEETVLASPESISSPTASSAGSEPGKSAPSCSNSPALAPNMAVGSGIAAARRLRSSASSTRFQSSENRTSLCRPCEAIGDLGEVSPPDLETCPICLDDLSGKPLGICLGSDGCRACQHYFHLDCLRRVEGARCPQCRVRFHVRAELPSITKDVEAWCSHVSASGKLEVNMREVCAALKAMLMLAPDDIETLVQSMWGCWADGNEFLNTDMVQELAVSIAEHLPETNSDGRSSPQSKAPEDESAKLEDGHTRSGVVCSCGQVHVRRGDRISRGPAQSDVDEEDVVPGQLGTIVRIGEGQESVKVKWDRSAAGKVHTYTWPDPEGLVLSPASFTEIAADVMELQAKTGLSSMAAEEVLRRADFQFEEATAALLGITGKTSEANLRKPLKPFHRVRLLPDKLMVQQWFDNVSPCQCSKPSCCGGVQWSSRAEKHLGREGFVLKMDGADDTVLVETRGPCNCQIWYPRLALEPAYDPDLDEKPLFEVNNRVECKMRNGWEKGIVKEVLWRGAERQGPCPYSVKLDNGSDIFVPHANLIRAA